MYLRKKLKWLFSKRIRVQIIETRLEVKKY